MSEALRIGTAEVSITPEGKSISLIGQFYERISEFVETPITMTCIAVADGKEQMTIISCDLTGVSDVLVDAVRAKCTDIPGFEPQKLIMNATHTHTSHTYSGGAKNTKHFSAGLNILARYMDKSKYQSLTGDRKPDMGSEEAFEFLTECGAKAVHEAWENLHPASIIFGFGRAAIGMCRRAVYDDGTAKMWGDTNMSNFKELEGGNDSGIELAYVFGEDKKLECVVANVACPSQILEHRSIISSDYWGKLRILLRARFGEDLKVVGLCSAAGDMCPRDLIRWVDPETPVNDPNIKHLTHVERNADPSMFDVKGSWKAGKRLYNEIVDTYEEIIAENRKPAEIDVFKHQVLTVDLPLRKVTITEYEQALEKIENFVEKHDTFTFEENASMHVYAGTAARYETQQTHDIFPIEVHVIRLGSVAIATNPFELFLDYGNQIRARSLAKQTFLIQLCNGSYGYLPTEKAERGSHYSAYVSSGYVGHVGGDQLVRKTTDAIDKLFGREE
ncbi:MAG: hypothetical protein IKY02_05610 [Lachnospiraceae bacterium]|nr:hypothetical protein [Lachnospiraceae bacterium]